MTRVEAIKEAESLVDRLDPKKNERGYDRNTAGLPERVAAILRVAEWLMGQGDDTERDEPMGQAGDW